MEQECFACENGYEEFYTKIKGDINEYGRSVICVGGNPVFMYTNGRSVIGVAGNPVFMYTIGLHKKGLPELLMIGLIDVSLMNYIAEMLEKRGEAFDEGLLDIGGKCPLKVVNCHQVAVSNSYTCQVALALEIAEEDYKVQQLVIPDTKGRFPGDNGVDPVYGNLPVIV